MSEELRPIVAAAQAGDREALERLGGCVDRFVRIFSGKLSRQVRRVHGSTIDFVLEGIAHALRGLDSFEYESDEHFYAWITRSIRGRIVDAWRGEERQKRAGRPLPIADGGYEPPAPDPTASRVVSESELRGVIGREVLSLHVDHPREMEVVVLKLFEGESWARIREILELSSDRRARTLFAHGIDLLRPGLGRSLGEDALQSALTTRTDSPPP